MNANQVNVGISADFEELPNLDQIIISAEDDHSSYTRQLQDGPDGSEAFSKKVSMAQNDESLVKKEV